MFVKRGFTVCCFAMLALLWLLHLYCVAQYVRYAEELQLGMSVLLRARNNAQGQPLRAYLENSESSTGNTYSLDGIPIVLNGNKFCTASKEQEQVEFISSQFTHTYFLVPVPRLEGCHLLEIWLFMITNHSLVAKQKAAVHFISAQYTIH